MFPYKDSSASLQKSTLSLLSTLWLTPCEASPIQLHWDLLHSMWCRELTFSFSFQFTLHCQKSPLTHEYWAPPHCKLWAFVSNMAIYIHYSHLDNWCTKLVALMSSWLVWRKSQERTREDSERQCKKEWKERTVTWVLWKWVSWRGEHKSWDVHKLVRKKNGGKILVPRSWLPLEQTEKDTKDGKAVVVAGRKKWVGF